MTTPEDVAPQLRLGLTPQAESGGGVAPPVDAWLLPGSDACAWLEALTVACERSPGVRLAALDCYVVPESIVSRAPAGLVVVGSGELAPPPPEHGAQGLRRDGAVLLPVGSRLDPPLTEGELSAAFPMHLHLLHPRLGHVGFESSDRLGVDGLVGAPPLLSGTWSAARPGATLPAALGPIVAVATEEDLARFEFEARDEIGVESPSSLVRRGPREVISELATAGFLRLPARSLARAALWYAGRVPATSDVPTWVDRAAGWAQRVLGSERGSRRAKEVRRLMQLLREDPDRGLRFAIPLGGSPLERGRHWGSQELSERRADFDLDQLGGTRGVDDWKLAVDERFELEKLYRTRAIADAAAGRHRRAAYIHAYLLGDLRAAAGVLQDGGHHREAAALWRDRLDMPAEAASCLERGGLFEEALAIHRERGDATAEALLLERLGRRGEAAGVWRRAVEEALDRDDPVRAARVLEERLGDVDGAAAILRSRWPAGRRAEASLDEWFRLCDGHGRGAELREWIARERDRALVDGRALTLLQRLGTRCGALGDEATRGALADALRCAVGAALGQEPRLPVDEARARLDVLRTLDATDRLFDRDLMRYRDGQLRRPRATGKRPMTARRATVEALEELDLPPLPAGDHRRLVGGDDSGLLFATHRVGSQSLAFERLSWTGAVLGEQLVERVDSSHGRAAALEPLRPGDPMITVLFRQSGQLGPRVNAPTREAWRSGAPSEVRCATPAFLGGDTLDVLSIAKGELWAAQSGDDGSQLWLRRYDADGRILDEERVAPHDSSRPVRLGVLGRSPVVFRDDGVLRLPDDGPAHPLRLRGSAFEVLVSPRATLQRSLLVTGRAVRLFLEADGIIRDQLLSRSHGAKATFLRGGAIAIVDADSVRVLRTRDQEAHLVARFDLPEAQMGGALSIVPGSKLSRFAVHLPGDRVQVFEVGE